MQWKTANHLDRRERKYFAIFPAHCEDGITRWLCWVRVVEEYQPNYDPLSPVWSWTPIEFHAWEA